MLVTWEDYIFRDHLLELFSSSRWASFEDIFQHPAKFTVTDVAASGVPTSNSLLAGQICSLNYTIYYMRLLT